MAQRLNKAGRSVSMYRKKGLGVGDWQSRQSYSDDKPSVGEILTTVGEKALDVVATPIRSLGGAALAGTKGIKTYQGIIKNKRNIVIKAAGVITGLFVAGMLLVPKVIQSAFKSNEEVKTEITEDIEEIQDNAYENRWESDSSYCNHCGGKGCSFCD